MARPLTVTAFGNAQVDTSVRKTGTGSIQLDGNGDYLVVDNSSGDLNTTTAWTIEAWIYPTDATNLDYNICCGGADIPGSNQARGFNLQLNLENGASNTALLFTTFSTSGGGISGSVNWLNRNDFPVDQWVHIAVCSYDNGELSLFVNGTRVGNTIGNAYTDLIARDISLSTNKNIFIGTDPNVSSNRAYFNGWIDEVKISSVARYTGNFTPASALGTDGNTLLKINGDGTDASTTFSDDVGINGTANLSAAFTVDRADGRTFLRASANLEAFATELAVQNPSPSMVYLENDVFTWADTDTWDTIYDSDDKWAVWERLNASFSITAIGSDFDVASSSILFEAGLEVSAGVQKSGQANLSDAFTQTAKAGFLVGINDPYDYTWDTIPEDQWNSFFTDQWRPDGWFAFDAVTLTSRGGLELNATATLDSQAAVAVDARLSDIRGTADLNSQFTLTSGSDNSKSGSAILEAFATEVTVARLSDVRASAELVSQFTLTSGSDNSKDGTATLTAQAELTSTSGVTLVNAATLDSQFALESQSRILKLANLDITSLGDLSVVGSMTLNAGAGLQGEFTETVQAGYQLSGQTNLVTEFTSIINATLIPSVELDEVAFNADLTARGQITYGASARLEAFAAEITAGQRAVGGRANLEAAFTAIVSGTATLAGSARLEAFVTELVDGRISTTRGSATLTGTFAAEFAGELKLLDSQFIYKVLNENRTFGIESEIRKYTALPENRLFGIDPESRLYQVLPENRTVDVGYFMQ